MTILVIAPHQDDETIGCGGFIARSVASGHTVLVQHVFRGNSGVAGSPDNAPDIRNAELTEAAAILGCSLLGNFNFPDRSYPAKAALIEQLAQCFAQHCPDIVLCPHEEDSDKEHELVHFCCKEALWLSKTKGYLAGGSSNTRDSLLLFYEVWSPIRTPAFYLDITGFMDQKQHAIGAFGSQLRSCDWIPGATGLNAYRGSTLQGSGFCEAFGIHKCNSTQLQHLLEI